MKQVRQVWNYIFSEPFSWIFLCFFQPSRFVRDYSQQALLQRSGMMLRLLLPLILIAYPLALIVHVLLYGYFSNKGLLAPYADWTGFFWAISWTTALSIVIASIGGVAGDARLGIVMGIALGIVGNLLSDASLSLVKGIAMAVTLGVIGGIVGRTTWHIRGGIIGGIVGGVVWGLAARGTSLVPSGVEVATTFIGAYLLGYYRLPLYPVSGASSIRAYLASRRQPEQVFEHLHRSALYWDECIHLPLPGLKPSLLIAVEKNTEQTTKEIRFIFSDRPQQMNAARIALLEIAIHDQETRTDINEIAQAFYQLTDIVSQGGTLLDPLWVPAFTHLSDASRDAAQYCSSQLRPVKQTALDGMMNNLKMIHPNTTIGDEKLRKRLMTVVDRWLEIGRKEQEALEQTSMDFGPIENPFSPGQVLQPKDTLFVGRRDLVQALEAALEQGNNRPSFFLSGERRMGKSSTLRQLPNLLGARYLPVIYDLQIPGTVASTTTLLDVIAMGIHEVMAFRGIETKRLKYEQIRRGGAQK